MTAHEVKGTIEQRSKALAAKQAENELLLRQIRELETEIASICEELSVSKDAQLFLEELANSRRGAMKGRIESVITEALRFLYGPSYRAELTYSFKSNRSSLEIEMVRETPKGEVRRNIGGIGGGVADTMSVPMRLMVLTGSKKTDKVCILDECWKHMDESRIELVAQFVKMLTEKLGIQVIFFTHHAVMREYADKVYEVTEKDGRSSVAELNR
jgi:DNA repair exonuclease SbcCD ATPase subunit